MRFYLPGTAFASNLDCIKDSADEVAEYSRLASVLVLRKAESFASRGNRRQSEAGFGTTDYYTVLRRDHKSKPWNRSDQQY